MKRRFSSTSSSDPVTVVRLDKSGGCVDRDESYMKSMRQQQIREYFFGHGSVNLSPYTNQVDFAHLSIYRIIDSSAANSFDPGLDDEDDIYDPAKGQQSSTGNLYEKVVPSLMLQNSLLAVTHAEASDSQDSIRDASVMGYVYAVDVDEAKRRVNLLGPVSGRLPNKAMIWGSFPEEVIDLV
jgi:polyribonucleotide 5'-hydroxyl-kinase